MHAAAGDCAAAVARVRTGMACVTCWSFSLVGAGSSARAWLNLVCWLLILIRARSLEHRRLGRPRPSRSLASHTLCERRVTGGTEAPEATCTCVDGGHVRTATQTPHTLQDLGSICPYLPESGIWKPIPAPAPKPRWLPMDDEPLIVGETRPTTLVTSGGWWQVLRDCAAGDR